MNPLNAWPRYARVAAVLFIILAGGVILKVGEPVLVPLVLSVLIAFVLYPLVKRLQRWGFSQLIAVITVVAGTSLLLALVAGVVGMQLKMLADDLPRHRQNIEERMLTFKRYLRGGTVDRVTSLLERIHVKTDQQVESESSDDESEAADPAERQISESDAIPVRVESTPDQPTFWTSPLTNSALGAVGTAGLVMVLVIFLLLGIGDVRSRLVSLTGRGALATTTKALDEAGGRISRFLLMQFIINATYGLGVAIGLLIIQVPYAPLWGLVAATLRYLPYVGPWIAALMPIAATLMLSNGWTQPVLVVALFIVLELLSNNVMEPILYGHSVGLSPLAVIISAIVWAWLWGPIGLVVATPLTACLVVLGRYVPGLRILDQVLGERPDVGGPLIVYQRLLAHDEEDAEEFIEDYLRDHSQVEARDELLVPLVELMHQDRRRALIDDDDVECILEAVKNFNDELDMLAPEDKRDAAPSEELTQAAEADEVDSRPVIAAVAARSQEERVLLELVERSTSDMGCRFTILPNEMLISERIQALVELDPVAICVSTLPPDDRVQLRQFCKRIRERLPNAKLLVIRWNSEGKPGREDLLKSAGADHVIADVTATLAQLRLVLHRHRAQGAPTDTGRSERCHEPESQPSS